MSRISTAMVTNHLRAPYGVYFTKHRTILRRPSGGRKNRTTFFYQFSHPIVVGNLKCLLSVLNYCLFQSLPLGYFPYLSLDNPVQLVSDKGRTIEMLYPVQRAGSYFDGYYVTSLCIVILMVKSCMVGQN